MPNQQSQVMLDAGFGMPVERSPAKLGGRRGQIADVAASEGTPFDAPQVVSTAPLCVITWHILYGSQNSNRGKQKNQAKHSMDVHKLPFYVFSSGRFLQGLPICCLGRGSREGRGGGGGGLAMAQNFPPHPGGKLLARSWHAW